MILGAFLGNLLFMVSLAFAYVFVTRRREKVYILVDHLASLARQGMPLQAGLRALGKDLGGFFGTRLGRAARRLEEGATLGEAFGSMPRTFPPLLRSMVALGEKSGNLSSFLDEMRRSYRRIAELPHQLAYLFVYPVTLTLAISLFLMAIYAGLAPKFIEMLQQTRAEDRFSDWWPRLLVADQGVLALCFLMIVTIALGGGTAHFGSSVFRFFKGGIDRLTLVLPVLRGLVRDGAAQHFSLSVGLFLRAGASLPEAVRAAGETERNGVLARRLARLAARLAEGGRLSACLREARLFADDLLWFVESGEAAGALPDHLLQAAAHYGTKIRFAARMASRAVIPFFVVLNGGLVFGTFLLIFLPMRSIVQSVIPN